MKLAKTMLSIVLISTLLVGCSATRKLSDMSIAQGVSIDYKNNETQISVQYLDLAKGTGTTDTLGNNITSVAFGTGVNISDAISNTSATLSSPIFFGQNKILVFGKEYAQKGLHNSIDYVLRGVDSRPDVLVAICEATGQDVINAKENQAKVPAQSIYDMLQTGERLGMLPSVTVNELINLSASPTSDVYLPCLKVYDEKAQCNGMAVFSDEELSCFLDETESLGFLLLQDKISGATVVVESDRLGNVGVQIKKISVKNHADYKNGRIVFDSKIKAKIVLNDTEQGTSSKVNQSDISVIESLVSKTLEDYCRRSLAKIYENKSDPLMIGKMLARSNPSAYEKLKSNWRENLPNMNYSVSVSSRLELISDSLSS